MGPLFSRLASSLKAGADEKAFQDWYGQLAKEHGWDPNPDDPEQDYNYRGLWREVQKGDASGKDTRGHWPSEFKKPGHPRTYLQDTGGQVFDTRSAKYLTGAGVTPEELVRSEKSADLPGYLPGPWKGMGPERKVPQYFPMRLPELKQR